MLQNLLQKTINNRLSKKQQAKPVTYNTLVTNLVTLINVDDTRF